MGSAAASEPPPEPGATGTAATATAADAEAPAATGIVQLAVSPWAEVEVDGRVVGITPPMRELSLPAGRHKVSLRNGAFAPHVRTIEIGADEIATIRHRFGP